MGSEDIEVRHNCPKVNDIDPIDLYKFSDDEGVQVWRCPVCGLEIEVLYPFESAG